jgi:hypothetical protein
MLRFALGFFDTAILFVGAFAAIIWFLRLSPLALLKFAGRHSRLAALAFLMVGALAIEAHAQTATAAALPAGAGMITMMLHAMGLTDLQVTVTLLVLAAIGWSIAHMIAMGWIKAPTSKTSFYARYIWPFLNKTTSANYGYAANLLEAVAAALPAVAAAEAAIPPSVEPAIKAALNDAPAIMAALPPAAATDLGKIEAAAAASLPTK